MGRNGAALSLSLGNTIHTTVKPFEGGKKRRSGASCRPFGTSWDVSNRLPWADGHGYNMSPLRGYCEDTPACSRCKLPMTCSASSDRPSWREILGAAIYPEAIYSPLCHLVLGKRPACSPFHRRVRIARCNFFSNNHRQTQLVYPATRSRVPTTSPRDDLTETAEIPAENACPTGTTMHGSVPGCHTLA